jgi:IS5 family transposase
VIVNGKTREIIDVCEGPGKEHDFNLYKRSIRAQVHETIPVYADLGYLGIEELHANSKILRKASKYRPLSDKDKEYNGRLAKKRVVVEHINAKIKTFKSMAYPYRNHCKRHLLRMSLICGIINYEKLYTCRK